MKTVFLLSLFLDDPARIQVSSDLKERDTTQEQKQIQIYELRNPWTLTDFLKIGDSVQLLSAVQAVRLSLENYNVHAAEGLGFTPIFKGTLQPSFPRTWPPITRAPLRNLSWSMGTARRRRWCCPGAPPTQPSSSLPPPSTPSPPPSWQTSPLPSTTSRLLTVSWSAWPETPALPSRNGCVRWALTSCERIPRKLFHLFSTESSPQGEGGSHQL